MGIIFISTYWNTKLKNKRLTDQQKIDLVKRYLDGEYSRSFLAKDYGITTNSVTSLLKKRGIPIVKHEKK